MNLTTILEDALDAAKKFISWLLPSSKKILDIALAVVNGIKEFDDAHPDVANFITSIIPGTADDAIVAKIRQYLPDVLVRLKWADFEAGKTPDEIVADGAKFLQSLPKPEQAVAYQSLWQLLSNYTTDDSVALDKLQEIGQVYYTATKS